MSGAGYDVVVDVDEEVSSPVHATFSCPQKEALPVEHS